MDEVKRSIRDFVLREYMEESDALDVTTPLISGGLVDPSSMVSLKRFLERRYNIQIPDADVTAETFDSVNKIAELVTRLRSGTAPTR